MKLSFSIIIPVYNRPNEIKELLESLVNQTDKDFEVLIIEDGSKLTSKSIVDTYKEVLVIRYYFKENTGAGQSRNFGMKHSQGNYYIILDSDVIVPPQYIRTVRSKLQTNYTDAYGGADAAHDSFTTLQKAINYSMTSRLTTGGIRGKKKAVGKFQPRSFNLGLSKNAFVKTNGFSKMTVGEDIDLSFRLWEQGFETQLIESAFVYHKRRSTLEQFFKQTYAFGTGRPVLNRKFPGTAKITYWFPSVFILGLFFGLFSLYYTSIVLLCYCLYFSLLVVDAFIQTKNFKVAFLAIITTLTQFSGYGLGFLKSFLYSGTSSKKI